MKRGGVASLLVLLAITVAVLIVSKSSDNEQNKNSGVYSKEKFSADNSWAISAVKTEWRAMDGENVDQIFAKVSKVAHFVVREPWSAYTLDDGSVLVAVDWANKVNARDDETNLIKFLVDDKRSISLSPPYAQVMQLGWQAFALALLQLEANENKSKPNRSFLHDLSNLNFVSTPQGDLGNLLKTGRCNTGDPVTVDYTDSWGRDKPVKGDYFVLQISVTCNLNGPRYFTHDGQIIFLRVGSQPWKPYSFFANRIAKYSPGSWFNVPDPVEDEAFKMVDDAARRFGWNRDDRDAALKAAELRNDGTMIKW